ncbi:MAG: biopolymer transporter ExbD [Phycisphaerales bacterium]|nr:MAG: biopolymer transporter ExbD [Phycisphaerales bacterium]
MNFAKTGERRTGRFNMTPMIDVVLQLIIFFMYTSTFASMVRTPVDLPKQLGERELSRDSAPIVVDITHDGRVLVAGVESDLAELRRIVRAEGEERHGGDMGQVKVLVRADRGAEARHVNVVVRTLTGAGVRRWTTGSESVGETGGN